MSDKDELMKAVEDRLSTMTDAEKAQKAKSLKSLLDGELQRRGKPLVAPKKKKKWFFF